MFDSLRIDWKLVEEFFEKTALNPDQTALANVVIPSNVSASEAAEIGYWDAMARNMANEKTHP